MAWNDDVNYTVLVKSVNFRNIGNRETQKEKYLEAKRKTRKAVYYARYEAQRNRFVDVSRRDYQKCDLNYYKENIFEECIRNDDGLFPGSAEDRKIAWKTYHGKLLNTKFAWNKNNLPKAETMCGPHHLIDKGMVRDSVSKMNNGMVAAPPGLVLEMVNSADEKWGAMLTD